MKARRLAVLLIPVLVVALVGLVSASGRTPPSAAAQAGPAARGQPAGPGPGQPGAPVRRVQTLLNRHGFQVPVTGFYGPRTARQVRRFQAAHGIPGTGKVGP